MSSPPPSPWEHEKLLFVTPVVKDEDGRKLTRTMRRTHALQSLFDFYHAMVPTVPRGEGAFLYRGERVDGERTPEDYGMQDGDQIDFLLETKASMFVTLKVETKASMFVTLKVHDLVGRVFTRTMRRTDRLHDVIDFYVSMVPNDGNGRLVFRGWQISPENIPMDYEMKDDESIYIVFFPKSKPGQRCSCWKPPLSEQ
ncbi:hypothetical protein ACP70R_004611 [Stipagrostis hirtigluma subsp. patula]